MISSGFGRDFSGEKEHLVLGGPGHQGEWHLIWHADGHAAAGRRRSGWLLLLDYPDRPLNRLTSFFRIFVIIPIWIVLGTVSGAIW